MHQDETESKKNNIDPHNWVGAHADYLYNFAITRLNDSELARDIVQETFLGALEKVSSFHGRSTERTWLTAILKYKIIDVYRKRSSGAETIQLLPDEGTEDGFFNTNDGHWKEAQQPRPFGLDDHDPLISKEFNQILQRCMAKLPALWFSVFSMKHIDDMETDIICSELNVTASNCWVIIHRAKVNLRACLQKNWI
ncbi:sigma-70 family RNA polymerase sigma factor [Pedobacter frigidisoli]|uniref:Sigma-70 family RNA polymerase sigma factor n=1 Tax=Pedobacter frigidisoli TaxID=2530455 RepID=A0A4R0P5F8_9SPHI|nr:sigma-70 family RNA polymerase sigma factor [Pedobacter frigidisoli]TCD07663.1 sigma-70 family RNA polymerase sigma factor [Pedobacter frigidisoli]